MNNPSLRRLLRFIPVAFMLAIAGCGGGADGSGGNTNVRLLNLSTGYDSIDLFANNGDTETDTTMFTAVTLNSLSDYKAIKGDTYTLKFRKTGTTGNLTSSAVNLASGTHLTLIAFGATNQFALDVVDEDVDAPTAGYSKLTIVNTSLVTGFDVYLTGATDSLDDVSPTLGVAARSQTSPATVSSGTYRLRITKTGDKNDVRLNIPQITLGSTSVMSLIVTETDGGVLVNAIALPKQGQPTTYRNTSTSQVRVLNVSGGYDPIDVYTKASGSDTDVSRFTNVARGTATAYAALPADTYAIRFRRSGAAGNLLSLNATLAEDRHATYVSYGTTNQFAVVPLDEEVTKPDPGYTKVRILNATGGDKLDVYLTDANDSLNNVSAAVSNVLVGALSSFSTVNKGTYRLRITKAGDKLDVRLDVPTVTLADQGVLNIIVSETAGGVLLDSVLLPQQGEPVRLDNSKVRIRGAVGLSTGSLATVRVGTTDLLTNRSARSFIADAYTILPAGSSTVTVIVDGVQVASQAMTLQSGRDYTLLVWNSGATISMTLVPDSNFVASSHKPKVRLLNAASGLAAPLTLLADYSPIAEFIQPGSASDGAEVRAGSDIRLDVLNTNTLATVLTRENVVLETDGVYTLFVAGGGVNSVSGILRKDR